MGLSTLAGHPVTRARATLPRWGCWFADAAVAGEHELAAGTSVELAIADLTLKGTIIAGGTDKGRSYYRVGGGKASWGKIIAAANYANDAGEKVAKVLGDAARAAGETLDTATIASSARVGPGFTRPEAPASFVLEQVSPGAWYVGEDGVTRLGARPTTQLSTSAARVTPVDRARATVTLAADSIKQLVPGVVVDGMEAVDVEHEISAEGGLRTKVWGKRGATGTSRTLHAIKKVLEFLDPDRLFRGLFEYRVVTLEGKRVNLQPVRASTGMPTLRRVPMLPGVAGCDPTLMLGARVFVAFVDADPSRPVIVNFEDPEGEGFLPMQLAIDAQVALKLGLGVQPVARGGDLAGIFPVVPTQFRTFA